MEIPLWLRMVGLISQIATGFLTLAVFILLSRYTAKVTRELKQADVLMEVNRKFDALTKDYEELAKQATGDATHYYKRFWSLQNQQFRYWRQGLIDDENFRHWMYARQYDFEANEELYKVSFRDGWKRVRGSRFEPAFIKLINEISNGTNTDVDVAMMKARA